MTKHKFPNHVIEELFLSAFPNGVEEDPDKSIFPVCFEEQEGQTRRAISGFTGLIRKDDRNELDNACIKILEDARSKLVKSPDQKEDIRNIAWTCAEVFCTLDELCRHRLVNYDEVHERLWYPLVQQFRQFLLEVPNLLGHPLEPRGVTNAIKQIRRKRRWKNRKFVRLIRETASNVL